MGMVLGYRIVGFTTGQWYMGLVVSGSFRDITLGITPSEYYKALLPLRLDRITGLSTLANRVRAIPGNTERRTCNLYPHIAPHLSTSKSGPTQPERVAPNHVS